MTTEPVPAPHHLLISVVDAAVERVRLRAELDRFEERYQLPSERLAEAFTRADGSLDESEDFHAWDGAWTSYQILTGP
jgi:FAD/FMN-containing dehydrogenase